MAPLLAAVALLCLGTPALASPVVVEQRQAAPGVVEIPVVATLANTTAAEIVAADHARLDRYFGPRSANEKRQSVVPAQNVLGSYVADVGVGANNKIFRLVVDTGSSNTWLGAQGGYVRTSTSKDTGKEVYVGYGSGWFDGEEVTVTDQGIGVASRSDGFANVDGILGLGPEDLTSDTISDGSSVPTFMQNAVAQKKIPANILGVYFAPTTTAGTSNGRLTLGGTSPSLYTDSITYGPITSTSHAADYWGVDVTFLADGRPITGTLPGIVDTGTTLVLLASDVAARYYAGTGFSFDNSTQFYRSRSASGLKPFGVIFAGTTFTLTTSDILVPAADYEPFELEQGYYYSWIGATKRPSGSGLDFLLGQKFLEHFYSVYDTDNHRVGLACTRNP